MQLVTKVIKLVGDITSQNPTWANHLNNKLIFKGTTLQIHKGEEDITLMVVPKLYLSIGSDEEGSQ